MQLKIFKRASLFLSLIIVASLSFIIYILFNHQQLGDKVYTYGIIYILISLVVLLLFADYDLHAAQRKVEKMVKANNIALATITKATGNRLIRDSKFNKYFLWNVELKVYDQDLNCFSTTCIEKFALEQREIPQGNVYVTYDPNKPQEIFIIPNSLIQMSPNLMPIVEKYENKLKLNYLHCYYNNGLVIKTYKDAIKEEESNKNKK